ncbi:MAG: anthranilate phosphoribosyltransferase [Gammaproteobacteria bacterium]|nr:anthranilate phosphoribosyltransferase [Gammaproteobacteria bacterium]
MTIQEAIAQLLRKQDLNAEQMTDVMHALMTGNCTEAQIAGFLIALAAKGESAEEIAAGATVMRSLAAKVSPQSTELVDIVGTGGDASGTFNVSTACSFVVAGAGAKVAKHGSRSVSSKSGASDLLQAAGVNIALSPTQVAHCIDEVGVGFMFAPNHHSAMKYVMPVRQQMAVRTVFNLLGPLTNPAFAKRQLIGVFDQRWVRPFAEVLKSMGSERAMVVHSADGMDEISIADQTHYALLDQGTITEGVIQPEDFGLPRATLADIQVETPQDSLSTVLAVLNGAEGPARDMVALNSGAAIFVAGLADDIAAGIFKAQRSIDSAAARQALAGLIEKTQSMAADA